jgi:hypothetical protein
MKTSLSGSRRGTSSRQASRAAATSGLSCSAACAVFFEGDGVAVQETPNRTRRKRRSQLGFEHVSNLDKGHIRLRFDRAQDHLAMRLNAVRALIAALRLGTRRSPLTPLLYKAHHTRRRNPEPLRRRRPARPRLQPPVSPGPADLQTTALPCVLAPLSSTQGESDFPDYGNPCQRDVL